MEKETILNNGVRLPKVGFGTHRLQGEVCKQAIHSAVEGGYELIDTASIYKNAVEIGEVLQQYPEKKVMIITKISPYEMGTEKSIDSVNRQLEALQVECLDVVLIHWPGKARAKHKNPIHQQLRQETWLALEKLVDEGKIGSIGVSNYEIPHLEEHAQLVKQGVYKYHPAINQVEFHPMCQQKELLSYCKQNNIALQAYSPLGTAGSDEQPNMLLSNDVISLVAHECGRSIAQVLLRWGLQAGASCVLPRSGNPSHIKSMFFNQNVQIPAVSTDAIANLSLGNVQVFDFELTEDQMKRISDICKEEDTHFCWQASGVK